LHVVKDVGYRIAVNIIFWGAVAGGLMMAEGRVSHIPLVGPKNSEAITVSKIIDFADGDLWFFQIFASVFLLLSFMFFRKNNEKQYDFFRPCAQDELFGTCLNFGSLFIFSGVYMLFHRENGLLNILFGIVNLTIYAFWSNFKGESEKKEEGVENVDNQLLKRAPGKPFFAFASGFLLGAAIFEIFSKKGSKLR
jgi:hypothetical protein